MWWSCVQGDRWQPPELPNTGEVLIRPEPVEEAKAKEEAVPQAEQAPKESLDLQEASLPTIAAPADISDRPEQRLEAEEEKDPRQHRHRSAHCQQQLHVTIMLQQWLKLAPSVSTVSAYVNFCWKASQSTHHMQLRHCFNGTATHLLLPELAKIHSLLGGWTSQSSLFMLWPCSSQLCFPCAE